MSARSAGLGPAHTRAGPARAGRSNPPTLPWSPGGIACRPPRWRQKRLHLDARPRIPGRWRPTLRRDVLGLLGAHSTCQNLTTLRIGKSNRATLHVMGTTLARVTIFLSSVDCSVKFATGGRRRDITLWHFTTKQLSL